MSWHFIVYTLAFVALIIAIGLLQRKSLKRHRTITREIDEALPGAIEVARRKYKERHGTSPKEFDTNSFNVISLHAKKGQGG